LIANIIISNYKKRNRKIIIEGKKAGSMEQGAGSGFARAPCPKLLASLPCAKKESVKNNELLMLTHLGSNQDSAESKSDVLPITPWVSVPK
jgi:hypothetical protein